MKAKEIAPSRLAAAQQVRLGKRKLSLAGLRRFVEVPQQFTQAGSTRGLHFKPVVSGRWLDKQNEAIFMVALIGGLFGGFFDFAMIGVGATVPGAAPISIALVAAVTGSWATPLTLLTTRRIRGSRQNFNAFLNWLHGRYNLTLNAKQGLPKVLNSRWIHSSTEAHFRDEGGKHWTLRGTYNDSFYVADSNGSEYQVHGALPEHTQRVVADYRLPGELLTLHRQVQQRIAKLTERQLTPESAHVVQRANRDSAQVLSLYVDLHELGAVTAEQQGQMRQVLTQLSEELGEVLQAEVARALAAMTIESTYVAARKKREGIQLTKRS